MSVERHASSWWRGVRLIAMRELVTRLASRSLRIATGVTLGVLTVGVLAGALFSGGEPDSLRIGVAASAGESFDIEELEAAGGGGVTVVSVTGDAAEALERDDLEAVVLGVEDGVLSVVTENGLGDDARDGLDAVLAQSVLRSALDSLDLGDDASTDGVLAQVAERRIEVQQVDPADPDRTQRLLLAYIALTLLFFAVAFVGGYVAVGVVEEKANGIIEPLLVVITPGQLLAGKVAGLGAIGLGQLSLFGAVGIGLASVTGLLDVVGVALGLFGVVLAWYVLAYAFFAVLFAAAGSLVSRQEDVNAVTSPINLLAMIAFLVSQFSLTSPDSTLVAWLSWVPPFSAFLVPLRYASGDAGLGAVVLSGLVMALITVAITFVASRVYRASVLHTGSRRPWSVALRDGIGLQTGKGNSATLR